MSHDPDMGKQWVKLSGCLTMFVLVALVMKGFGWLVGGLVVAFLLAMNWACRDKR